MQTNAELVIFVMKKLFAFLICLTFISFAITANGQRRKSSDFFPILSKGKWGFVNKFGKVIIEPQFEGAWNATEGLACVRIEGKHGYVDASGKLMIPAQFESVNEFSEGLAAAGTTTGKYGYIDKSGRFVIAEQFDFAVDFSEGLAAVEINDKWGFVDKSGTLVVKPQFD